MFDSCRGTSVSLISFDPFSERARRRVIRGPSAASTERSSGSAAAACWAVSPACPCCYSRPRVDAPGSNERFHSRTCATAAISSSSPRSAAPTRRPPGSSTSSTTRVPPCCSTASPLRSRRARRTSRSGPACGRPSSAPTRVTRAIRPVRADRSRSCCSPQPTTRVRSAQVLGRSARRLTRAGYWRTPAGRAQARGCASLLSQTATSSPPTRCSSGT